MARRRMGMADIKEILVAWDAGEDISAIGRRLGYTRPTVRKYARAAEAAGLVRGGGRRAEAAWDRLAQAVLDRVAAPGRPTPGADEVAQFRAYLAPRVGTVALSVLHQRLRDEHGLRASWATFYRYVRAEWPEQVRKQPRVTIRLPDPPPGEEAQVDFFYVGPWDDPESGRRRKLHCFQMTLSHSRHTFLYPVTGEGSAAWLAAHVAALEFFGGCPARVVPDNLTAGVTAADLFDPRLHRAYGELARYYGFLIDPARVRRPQDKPRIERANGYARVSCFAGRELGRLEEVRAAARRWCLEVAGRRPHGTTGEPPLVAFRLREQLALQPLPERPWELASWTTALVHADCHLRVGAASYSVPHTAVGRRLDVRLGERTVAIYDGSALLTTHARQPPGGRATRVEHYPPAGQAHLGQGPAVCQERATAIGAATAALVAGRLTPYTLGRLREVRALLRLAESYPPERLEAACRLALDDGDGRYRTVRGILERELDRVPPQVEAPVVAAPAYLRGPAAFAADGEGAGRW
jgi:transposase